jgi:hypothetical protein
VVRLYGSRQAKTSKKRKSYESLEELDVLFEGLGISAVDWESLLSLKNNFAIWLKKGIFCTEFSPSLGHWKLDPDRIHQKARIRIQWIGIRNTGTYGDIDTSHNRQSWETACLEKCSAGTNAKRTYGLVEYIIKLKYPETEL